LKATLKTLKQIFLRTTVARTNNMKSTMGKIRPAKSWARFRVALSDDNGNASSPPYEPMNQKPLDEKPVDKKTVDTKPVREKATIPQPIYNFWNDQPSYDADAEGKAEKLKSKKRHSLTCPHPKDPGEVKVQLPALSTSELSHVLNFIYHNQDHDGRLVSHPKFLHKYIPEELIEPYDVKKADALFHEYVALNIDRVLTKDDP
jgi:hypothetical protein